MEMRDVSVRICSVKDELYFRDLWMIPRWEVLLACGKIQQDFLSFVAVGD